MKNNICRLPKVGDRLMKTMSCYRVIGAANDLIPEPCIVTYVNKKKEWYQVTFVNSGVKECYMLHDVDELSNFKKDYKKAFGKEAVGVYVYESGKIYDSISDCAKAIGVRPCTVSKHVHGYTSHVKGYHIYIL